MRVGRRAALGAASLLLFASSARAADRLLPLDVLFTEPMAYSYRLSPDSELVAAYLHLQNGRQLVLMDTKNSAPTSLINFTESDGVSLRDFGWIDADTIFIEFHDRGGRDRVGFVDIAFENGVAGVEFRRVGSAGQIVDSAPDSRDTLLFAREGRNADSRYRLYTITVEQLAEGDFHRATEFRNPLEGALQYRRDTVSGGLLAVTSNEDVVEHWYLGKDDRRWTRLIEYPHRSYQFIPIGVVDDGRALVLSNKTTNLMSLMEFDIESGQLGETVYQHPRYDLTGAEISAGTGELRSVSYTDHGIPVTEYLEETDARIVEILEYSFPGKQSRIVSGREGSPKKVVWISASDDPGRYYLLDVATRKAELLTPRFEALEDYALVASEVFTVQAPDGQALEAIVTRPESSNGVLLVNPHGGPVGVRDIAAFDQETQFFANRGYTVLQVNFRGSWGFGKEFLETGRGQFGQRIEDDISVAVDRLMQEESFEHVCSIGASYGGYSAMMLAIRDPGLYRCVIARYGIYDLPYLFNSSNFSQLDEYRSAVAHVVGEYSERLADVSPVYLAESLQSPVLLIAGEEDAIADYEHSNRMKYRLQQLGKAVDYFFYEDVGHGQHNWNGDRHEFALIDHFIRRTLELPAPAAGNADAVLADGYWRIAHYYSESDYPEHDDDLVLRYLHMAADLGSSGALHWLASLYERGSGVPLDFAAAVERYRGAAEGGYRHSSYRLGELHRDDALGELSAADPAARAFELFSQAHEQGHELAGFEMAAALCAARGVERDVDRCLSLLELPQDPDDDETERRDAVVAGLAWDDALPGDVKARLVELMRDATGSTYRELSFISVHSGHRDDDGRLHDRPVPLRVGSRFGVDLRVNAVTSDRNDGRQYAVLVRWTGPRDDADGSRFSRHEIGYVSKRTTMHFDHRLEDDSQLLPGEWRLEIATLDGTLLVDESFEISG